MAAYTTTAVFDRSNSCAVGVRASAPVPSNSPRDAGKEHAFTVTTHGRVYLLAAPSAEDRDGWVAAITALAPALTPHKSASIASTMAAVGRMSSIGYAPACSTCGAPRDPYGDDDDTCGCSTPPKHAESTEEDSGGRVAVPVDVVTDNGKHVKHPTSVDRLGANIADGATAVGSTLLKMVTLAPFRSAAPQDNSGVQNSGESLVSAGDTEANTGPGHPFGDFTKGLLKRAKAALAVNGGASGYQSSSSVNPSSGIEGNGSLDDFEILTTDADADGEKISFDDTHLLKMLASISEVRL